jgi:hypothetical protein
MKYLNIGTVKDFMKFLSILKRTGFFCTPWIRISSSDEEKTKVDAIMLKIHYDRCECRAVLLPEQ